MADQGRTNPSERALQRNAGSNGNELSLGRAPTSYLDYRSGGFMSMLLEEASPSSPAKLPTNPELGQNQGGSGSASTIVHGPIPIEPYSCSSQMGNASTTIPSQDSVLGEFPTEGVTTVGVSDVNPHLTRTTTEPPCLAQPAEFNYMNYEYGNNRNIIRIEFDRHEDSSLSPHVIITGSVSNYVQATSVQPAPLQGFSTVSDRGEQTSQCGDSSSSDPHVTIDWSVANYEQATSVQPPPLQGFSSVNDRGEQMSQFCESSERILREFTEYIRNHPVVPENQEMDVDLEDDGFHDDEDEDEDDDGDDNEGDDDANGNEAVDQNRNEEAIGNGNVNAENNIVGMQEGGNVNVDDVDNDDVDNDMGIEEEDDGLEEDEILDSLAIDYYEAHPSLDTDPPPCSICLDDFLHQDLLGVLDCGHKFHYQCIREWLLTKNACPLCRGVGLAI